MAGSRLEKIGTIYTRASGLIKSKACRWEDRPLWFDLYEAFPPKEEPRFDRPSPNMKLREIFYEEDKIRALFHKQNKSFGSYNLFKNETKSLTQRFIESYRKVENKYEGSKSEDEIYSEALDMMKRDFKSEDVIGTKSAEVKNNQNEGVNVKVSELFKLHNSYEIHNYEVINLSQRLISPQFNIKMEELSNIHRYLIQFMLKNGVASIDRVLNYCRKVKSGSIDGNELEDMIEKINRVIMNQHFTLIRGSCEVSGEDLLMWINLKNDHISQAAQNNFSAKEIEYFRVLLDEIATSNERKLMFVVCLNITSTLSVSFTRENGSVMLNKWIKSGYFTKNGDYVHLGPRLIQEFGVYLRNKRPECSCDLCGEIAFTGSICDNCNRIFHLSCLSSYQVNNPKCPNCREEWSSSQVFKSEE